MEEQTDILTIAHKQLLLQEDLDVLFHIDRKVPGSVHYSINRYRKQSQWSIDDTGIIIYHIEKDNPAANYLELKFCVSGNVYCKQKQTEFYDRKLVKIIRGPILEAESAARGITKTGAAIIDLVPYLNTDLVNYIEAHWDEVPKTREGLEKFSGDIAEFGISWATGKKLLQYSSIPWH